MEPRPRNLVTPTEMNMVPMEGDGPGRLQVKSFVSFHRERGYPTDGEPRVHHTADSPFERHGVLRRLNGEFTAVVQVGANLSCTLCSAEGACVSNDAKVQLFEPPVPPGEKDMVCVSLTSQFGCPVYDEFCEKAGAVPHNFDVKVGCLEKAEIISTGPRSPSPKRQKSEPVVVDFVYCTALFFEKCDLDIDEIPDDLKRVAVRLMEQGYCATMQHAVDRGIKEVCLGLYPGFNNPESWVLDALVGALHSFRNADLDVVVMHTPEDPEILQERPFRMQLFESALTSGWKARDTPSPATAAALLVKKAMAESPGITAERAPPTGEYAIRDLVIKCEAPELSGVWQELLDLAKRANCHIDGDITVPHALLELVVPEKVPIVRIMVLEPAHVIRQVCTTTREYAEKLVAAKSTKEQDTLWHEGMQKKKMFKVSGPYTPADFTSGTYTIFRGGLDPELGKFSRDWGHNIFN